MLANNENVWKKVLLRALRTSENIRNEQLRYTDPVTHYASGANEALLFVWDAIGDSPALSDSFEFIGAI